MKPFAPCLALALCGFFVTSAPAVLISTANNGGVGTFTVSGTDLANSNQATFSSASLTVGTALFGSDPLKLFNGSLYDPSPNNNHNNTIPTLTPSDNAVLVISLNTALNAGGYDISTINTYTGTAQGRGGQAYDVAISNVGAPNTFIPLFSVTSALANNADGGPEVRVSTVQNAGNLLLGTGVSKVQFTFRNVGNESMYREIDLIGNASAVAVVVPEPATASLALLGLGGLMMRRRRNA